MLSRDFPALTFTLPRSWWRQWSPATPHAFTRDENDWFLAGWSASGDAAPMREHLRTMGYSLRTAAAMAYARCAQ